MGKMRSFFQALLGKWLSCYCEEGITFADMLVDVRYDEEAYGYSLRRIIRVCWERFSGFVNVVGYSRRVRFWH